MPGLNNNVQKSSKTSTQTASLNKPLKAIDALVDIQEASQSKYLIMAVKKLIDVSEKYQDSVVDDCIIDVIKNKIKVIKIAFSFSQRLYELPHRRPCRRTHPIGTFSINGNPLLAHFYIAGMFDGILVLGHQVRVNRLSDSCNPYLIHTNWHILV